MEPTPKRKKLRYKPSKEAVDATKKADKNIYKELLKAATEALIKREVDIILSFPYFCKFPEDWPVGILMERTPTSNVYRIKVRKLVDWLHKHGHSQHSATEIVKSGYKWEKHYDKLEKWFEGDLDVGICNSDVDLWNDNDCDKG